MVDTKTMATLEQFGIVPSSTTSPALVNERCNLDHATYTEKAFEILQTISEVVTSDLSSELETFTSRWHPSGFMIYQLGTVAELGMLRMHVWPDSVRKSSTKGDTIHDHSWHVAALALRGNYEDTLYDVTEEIANSDADRKAKGLLRLFTASYKPDTSQELTTGGTCVRATNKIERTIPEGEVHSINPGEFHQPTIPTNNATITLVLNSFRILNHGPYVLIDGPSNSIPEVRQSLSGEDIQATKEILTR